MFVEKPLVSKHIGREDWFTLDAQAFICVEDLVEEFIYLLSVCYDYSVPVLSLGSVSHESRPFER
jgi:hypothetical protein